MCSAAFEPLSKQFDVVRESIVAKYRERISSSCRSKLSKTELFELIDIFITRLELLYERDSIKQLCSEEMDLLEEGYPAASVAKNYLPKYRIAIRRSLALRDRQCS